MLQILLIYYYCGDQWRFYDGANGGLAPQFRVKPPSLAPSPNPSPLGHHKILGLSPSSLTSLKPPLVETRVKFERWSRQLKLQISPF